MKHQDMTSMIRRLYDEHVESADGAVALADTRQRLVPTIARELEKADRDFEAEATILIDKVLTDTRSARNTQMRDSLADIAAYIAAPEDNLMRVSGMLHLAYPLGTQRGEDKTLSLWTRQDLEFKVKTRYREASQTTAAAALLDQAASQILNLMGERAAGTIGELLTDLLPDEEAQS